MTKTEAMILKSLYVESFRSMFRPSIDLLTMRERKAADGMAVAGLIETRWVTRDDNRIYQAVAM